MYAVCPQLGQTGLGGADLSRQSAGRVFDAFDQALSTEGADLSVDGRDVQSERAGQFFQTHRLLQFEAAEQEVRRAVQMKVRALRQCVISRQQRQFVFDVDKVAVHRFTLSGRDFSARIRHIVQDTQNV